MESKKRFYSTVFKEKAVSLSHQRDNLKERAVSFPFLGQSKIIFFSLS
jgi:hypothetical protein